MAPLRQTDRVTQRRMPRLVTTRFQSTLALLIVLLITLPLAFSASAQDLDATVGHLEIEELEGVEAAISRSYAMNISTFVEAVASDTPQAVVPTGPVLMLAIVVQFDTADHASDAAGTVRDRLIEQIAAEPTSIEMELTEQEDLGDAAWTLTGGRESGPSPVNVDGLLVQNSEWLYLAIAISENDTGSDAVLALVQFALRNRVDTGEIIYDHTGLSQGGIWEKVPAEGDTITIRQGEEAIDALSGTQPIFDSQLLPPPPPEE
jgi:hypothetical protein